MPPVDPQPATTIDEVIQKMTGIDAALDADDGVACFNRLYLNVTLEIRSVAATTTFENSELLDILDVCFANMYFDAYDRVTLGQPCPAAWAPLFEHRNRPNTSRIQFALAGMNAHINHDLPLAVVSTASAHGVDLFGDSPYQRDYFRVNDVLADVEVKIRSWFTVGVIAELDKHLKGIDDALSMWCIHGARRAAWDTAEFLWRTRSDAHLRDRCESLLGEMVNLAGRAVLV